MNTIVVFGSYGYTGKLIVQECKHKKLQVLLAGRDREKLKQQSTDTGYPFVVADVNNEELLVKLFEDASLVIHCAGPFQHTAKQIALACIKTKTHYTDITGEFQVFENMMTYDADAKTSGITIMPGVGFDVVPSDCLAMHLKNRMPDATHLQLAFTSLKGGVSRGTALTSAESLGHGSYVRKEGKLVRTAAAAKTEVIDFGSFKTTTVSIPWGDIATAYRSTGIPNIEVFMGMDEKMIKMLRRSNMISWLLKLDFVKSIIKKQINKKITGPTDEKRQKGRSFLYGKVWDEKGNNCISLLETLDGYTLTAKTSVLIAEKILNGNFKPGFQTPSTAYGADLILEVENTERRDV